MVGDPPGTDLPAELAAASVRAGLGTRQAATASAVSRHDLMRSATRDAGSRGQANDGDYLLDLDRIENTYGRRQVIGRIETFRNEISTRIPHAFPH